MRRPSTGNILAYFVKSCSLFDFFFEVLCDLPPQSPHFGGGLLLKLFFKKQQVAFGDGVQGLLYELKTPAIFLLRQSSPKINVVHGPLPDLLRFQHDILLEDGCWSGRHFHPINGGKGEDFDPRILALKVLLEKGLSNMYAMILHGNGKLFWIMAGSRQIQFRQTYGVESIVFR